MRCLVCRSESRPVKYRSSRAQICQWCVTLLCEKPIDPNQVMAQFNTLIDSHVDKLCQPRHSEYYKRQARLKLGHSEHVGFFESIFNKAAVTQRESEAAALAKQLLAEDLTSLNANRDSMRASAVQSALDRNSQPTTTTVGYRGWTKTKDLIHPTLVKYINAIDLQLVSGTSKSDRPDQLEWEQLRQKVLEQDRYRCMLCNSYPREKHVHHIIPISKFGSNHPNNLITLCYRCHDNAHPDVRVTRYAP